MSLALVILSNLILIWSLLVIKAHWRAYCSISNIITTIWLAGTGKTIAYSENILSTAVRLVLKTFWILHCIGSYLLTSKNENLTWCLSCSLLLLSGWIYCAYGSLLETCVLSALTVQTVSLQVLCVFCSWDPVKLLFWRSGLLGDHILFVFCIFWSAEAFATQTWILGQTECELIKFTGQWKKLGCVGGGGCYVSVILLVLVYFLNSTSFIRKCNRFWSDEDGGISFCLALTRFHKYSGLCWQGRGLSLSGNIFCSRRLGKLSF